MTLVLERLHSALSTLQMSEIDALLETHLERAAKEERPYADFLCDLLEAEIEARSLRAVQARMRMANLGSVTL